MKLPIFSRAPFVLIGGVACPWVGIFCRLLSRWFRFIGFCWFSWCIFAFEFLVEGGWNFRNAWTTGYKKKTRKLRSVHFRCYVGYLKLFAIAYIYVDAKMEVEFLLSCKYINIQWLISFGNEFQICLLILIQWK